MSTTRDKEMALCCSLTILSMKVSGLKDKKMEKVNIRINHSDCTMKENGKKAKETALDIYKFKDRAYIKVLSHPTIELATAHRNFQMRIYIKVSIRWASSMAKAFTYGPQDQAMKVSSAKV